jgi:hypothetical protein
MRLSKVWTSKVWRSEVVMNEVGVRRAPVDTGRHRRISPVVRNIQGQGTSERLCGAVLVM